MENYDPNKHAHEVLRRDCLKRYTDLKKELNKYVRKYGRLHKKYDSYKMIVVTRIALVKIKKTAEKGKFSESIRFTEITWKLIKWLFEYRDKESSYETVPQETKNFNNKHDAGLKKLCLDELTRLRKLFTAKEDTKSLLKIIEITLCESERHAKKGQTIAASYYLSNAQKLIGSEEWMFSYKKSSDMVKEESTVKKVKNN